MILLKILHGFNLTKALVIIIVYALVAIGSIVHSCPEDETSREVCKRLNMLGYGILFVAFSDFTGTIVSCVSEGKSCCWHIPALIFSIIWAFILVLLLSLGVLVHMGTWPLAVLITIVALSFIYSGLIMYVMCCATKEDSRSTSESDSTPRRSIKSSAVGYRLVEQQP